MHYLNQFFEYTHLPENLQEVSKPFCILAAELQDLPDNSEKTTALRKLLEAKDCAVRAVLYQVQTEEMGNDEPDAPEEAPAPSGDTPAEPSTPDGEGEVEPEVDNSVDSEQEVL